MNLPDFYNHEGLNRLRKLMKAELPVRTRLEVGIVIDNPADATAAPDGTLEYKGRKVIWYKPSPRDLHRPQKSRYKYHVVGCTATEEYDGYVATRRTDGEFPVNPTDAYDSRTCRLNICQFCLQELGLHGVYYPDKLDKFPLDVWLASIDLSYVPPPWDGPNGPRPQPSGGYPPSWKFLSKQCREEAGWKCQECGLNLETNRYHLHAHHIDLDPHNNRLENLRALCRGCHAEQEGTGHDRMKDDQDYEEFLNHHGEEWKFRRRVFNLTT